MPRAHIPTPPPPAPFTEAQAHAAKPVQRWETLAEYKTREFYDRALARQIERQHQTGETL